MRDHLERVIIVYETQSAAQARLARFGYNPEIASEIAVYLAQSADLPDYSKEIQDGLASEDATVDFVELDHLGHEHL